MIFVTKTKLQIAYTSEKEKGEQKLSMFKKKENEP